MPDTDTNYLPPVAGRDEFESELARLRVREKAATREGDAIAAARRRLPMVEVDADLRLDGPDGRARLIDAFAGRRHLLAYYFMWRDGEPAAAQCEGCTWAVSSIGELSYLHSRDITFAVFSQGPAAQFARYRDFMGWSMPWYSAEPSLDELLGGGRTGGMNLLSYVRDGDRVYETYWTAGRGVEALDYSFALMDLTVHGRQETWEDSPPGWPQPHRVDSSHVRREGRPIAQWSRLDAGRSDDLTG